MTTAEQKAGLKEAESFLVKWRDRLHLSDWSFRLIFKEDPPEPETIAQVVADADYMRATITIYPGWLESEPKVREHAIVHELGHCLTEEIKSLVQRSWKDQVVTGHHLTSANERLVQRIANALVPINRLVLE